MTALATVVVLACGIQRCEEWAQDWAHANGVLWSRCMAPAHRRAKAERDRDYAAYMTVRHFGAVQEAG